MSTKEFEKLIELLKTAYQWTELKHAYRFNGIVDVWKDKQKVFSKNEVVYENFGSVADMEKWVVERLKKYPAQHAYKEGTGDKVTYREFSKIKEESSGILSSLKAEDYHWNLNENEFSEDSLYFIIHDGFVKIGRTKNIETRVKALKTSLSCSFRVFVFPRKGLLEKTFHKCFEDFRSNREWFKEDEIFAIFIKKHRIAEHCYEYVEVPKPRKMISPSSKSSLSLSEILAKAAANMSED